MHIFKAGIQPSAFDTATIWLLKCNKGRETTKHPAKLCTLFLLINISKVKLYRGYRIKLQIRAPLSSITS